MERLYPEVGYCTRNWKARKLLSNWYTNYIKSRKKDASSSDEEVEATTIILAKRPVVSGKEKKHKKKMKLEKGKGKAKAESDSSEDEKNIDTKPKLKQVIDPL